MKVVLCSKFSKVTWNENKTKVMKLPVCGVWHIDIPSREFQDLSGGAHSAVRVRFNL